MGNLHTPAGLGCFANVFTPRAYGDQEPKFSITMVFDEAAQKTKAYAEMREAVKQAAQEKFGADVNMKALRLPVRDCAEVDYNGFDIPNGKFVAFRTDTKPGIVDADFQDILDPSQVYSGALMRVSYTPYAYQHPQGGKGVSLGLRNVQVINNSLEAYPRLDGRIAADKDFAGAEDISSLAGGDFGADATAPAETEEIF